MAKRNDEIETDDRVAVTAEGGPAFRVATVLLLLPILLIWLLLAGPGRLFQLNGPVDVDLFQHGWPLVHLQRVVNSQPSRMAYLTDVALVNHKEIEQGPDGKRWMNASPFSGPLSDSPDSVADWMQPDRWLLLHGHGLKLVWAGVLGNLICLAIVVGVASWLARKRLKRRGLRISLLEFSALVLVAGLLFGQYERLRHWEKRIARLDEVGSIKLYDPVYRYDSAPDWLVRLVGRRFLPFQTHHERMVVDFQKMSDAERNQFVRDSSRLKHVRHAKLVGADRNELRVLANLVGLQELSLVSSNGEELWRAGLRGLSNLEILRIEQNYGDPPTNLDRAFFREISQISAIRDLTLNQCRFDSKDFSVLASHPGIRWLNLTGSNLDDELIEALVRMPNLRNVELRETGLTDRQFQRLRAARVRLQVVR